MIPDAAIVEQLEKLLADARFRGSDRLSSFLRYVVELSLAGRGAEIKEFLIATEVYGRSSKYDPRTDSIVRVEASRLRSKLRDYYEHEGRQDLVVIRIPVGAYVPDFTLATPPAALTPDAASPPSRRRFGLPLAAALAVSAGAAWLLMRSDPKTEAEAFAASSRAQELLRGDFRSRPRDGHVPPELTQAIALLEKSVALGPHSARNWNLLGDACEYAIQFDRTRGEEFKQKAIDALRRALQLDPRLAGAHAQLGSISFYENWDWPAAEASLLSAIALEPRQPRTHVTYSDLLHTQGRLPEALTEIERAQALDPDSPRLATQRGVLLYSAQRFPEALQEAERALAKRPDAREAHWLMGLCFEARGETGAAEERYHRILALSPDDGRALPALGHLYGRLGRRGEALAVAERIERLAEQGPGWEYAMALVQTGLGQREEAFLWLQRAYRQRDPSLVYLNVTPRLGPLRSDARFAALLQSLHLPK